jgi:hypothetical protein
MGSFFRPAKSKLLFVAKTVPSKPTVTTSMLMPVAQISDVAQVSDLRS